MSELFSFLPSIGLSKDIASVLSFVLLFVGLSMAAGFVFGRNKLVNIFINIYIALAFVSVIPVAIFPDTPYADAILFFVLLVFLTAIDQHLFDLHIPNASYDLFWRLFVMSVLVVGMIVSVLVSLLPGKVILSLPFPFIFYFFGPPVANILWLAIPIFVLIFMNKRLR
ncbi:MAG: hypothetical protein KBD19_03905 [Candidatus Moranbacteria bacterium]|nr:hypothetical protein [Candidatus Moranbacteria bacterium]